MVNMKYYPALRGYYVLGIIIGIMVGIGLVYLLLIKPNLRYNARGSHQSEAKTNLGAIFTAQMAYFGEHKTFAAGPDCFDLIGWGPESDTYYAYFCGEDVIPCTKKKCTSCTGLSELPDLPASTATGFTIYAVGNSDRDPSCDVWSMNDAKTLKNNVNDVAN